MKSVAGPRNQLYRTRELAGKSRLLPGGGFRLSGIGGHGDHPRYLANHLDFEAALRDRFHRHTLDQPAQN